MGSAERYWQHVRLSDDGRLQTRTIPWAQTFFQTQLIDLEEAPDSVIQQRLVAIFRAEAAEGNPAPELNGHPPDSPALTLAQLAACCLRCFVSHQIPLVCADLEHQFRSQTGLTKANLYPYVMEDVDPTQFYPIYSPLALRIVNQFDPDQSSLTTWTRRLVRQHKALHRVLEEDYGIYLASDWAILLRARPERLQRTFTSWTAEEVQTAVQILQAFHAVYRGDRLAQRGQTGAAGRRCHPPSLDQLNRMVQRLAESGSKGLPTTAPAMLQKLQTLAQNLRQRSVRADLSVDVEANRFLLDQPAVSAANQLSEPDAEQDSFLFSYRQAAQTCLEQAVDQAIQRRLAYFHSRPSTQTRGNAFLRAMLLFHDRGWSMKDIAPVVGLTEQFQVTRLLGLKELQADFYQLWLLLICEKLPALLQHNLEPEELEPIQQQLTAFLTTLHDYLNDRSAARQRRVKPEAWREQLHQICQSFPLVATLSGLIEAELKAYTTETYSPTRSQAVSGARSQISRCICSCLTRSQRLDLPACPPAPS